MTPEHLPTPPPVGQYIPPRDEALNERADMIEPCGPARPLQSGGVQPSWWAGPRDLLLITRHLTMVFHISSGATALLSLAVSGHGLTDPSLVVSGTQWKLYSFSPRPLGRTGSACPYDELKSIHTV